jgi:phosphoribosylanthranilate isomerase
MKVKICGLTNFEDASFALEAGADYLGFIFYPPSPRAITPEEATRLVRQLRDIYGAQTPTLVGLFVNETAAYVHAILDSVRLDLAQLSGDESLEVLQALRGRAYKAIRPQDPTQALELARLYTRAGEDDHPSLLLDAYHPTLYGGTGHQADTELARLLAQFCPRLMLAGGLTPENVAARATQARPFAVDVASGVEVSKGRKDPAKVRAFIQLAKAAS